MFTYRVRTGLNGVFSVGIYIFYGKKNHTEPFEIYSVTTF